MPRPGDHTPEHDDATAPSREDAPDSAVDQDHAALEIEVLDEVDFDGTEETWGALFKRLGPAGPLALLAVLMPAGAGFLLLGFSGPVGYWLLERWYWGAALYIGVFAITSGLALLPTYAQAFVGGWTYGLITGTPAALLGFGLGSLIGYEVSKRASGDRVLAVIESKPKWKIVYEAFLGASHEQGVKKWVHQFVLVTLVRLPPNSPFALTNLIMASVGVPRLIYFLGTLIGMAPRTALVVWFGSELQGAIIEDVKSGRPDWWIWVVIGSAIVMVLTLNHIAQTALQRAARQEAEPIDDEGFEDEPASP